MQFAIICLLAAVSAFATQQAIVVASPPTKMISGQSSLNNLGDTRYEGRISNLTLGGFQAVAFLNGNQVQINTSSQLVCLFLASATNNDATISIAGRTDIRFRCSRNTANTKVYAEIWDADGSNYAVVSNIANSNAATLNLNGNAVVGGADGFGTMPSGSYVHFYRVYSSIIPLASQPPADIVTTAPLIGWALDGSLTDQGATSQNLTGSVTYANSTQYPPIATIATFTSTRTNTTASLNGASSFSANNVDGIPTSYFWTCLTFPAGSPCGWTNRTMATPSLLMPLAGQYVIQLTVTDTTGGFDTASITAGAAASDSNGVVINPTTDANEDIFLPITRIGTSPWNMFDDTYVTVTNNVAPPIPTLYPGMNLLAGTVSASIGSTSVTGASGTTFQNDFNCNGTDYIAIHEPLLAGGVGNRVFLVASCSSQTSLVYSGDAWYISFPNPGYGPSGTVSSGMTYGRMTGTQVQQWTGGSDSFNYYDNVTSRYRLWAATGIEDYRTQARNLANNWWIAQGQGAGCAQGVGSLCSNPRIQLFQTVIGSWVEQGMVDLALWNRMSEIVNVRYNSSWGEYNGDNNSLGDPRESGFVFWWLALLAKYHPDSAARADALAKAESFADYFIARQGGDGTRPAALWGWVQDSHTSDGYTGNGSLSWHFFSILHGFRVLKPLTSGARQTAINTMAVQLGNFFTDQAWNSNVPCYGIRYAVLFTAPNQGDCTWSGGAISCSGSDSSGGCAAQVAGGSMVSNRSENQTLQWFFGWLYTITGNSAWLTHGDVTFGRTYGAGGTGTNVDAGFGNFIQARNDGADAQGKELGEATGVGAGSAYLAWRLGGVIPITTTSVSVGFSLAGVASAAKIRATITVPSGTVYTNTCASSPCVIPSVDTRQGAAGRMVIEYLSSGDVVLARGDSQPVPI